MFAVGSKKLEARCEERGDAQSCCSEVGVWWERGRRSSFVGVDQVGVSATGSANGGKRGPDNRRDSGYLLQIRGPPSRPAALASASKGQDAKPSWETSSTRRGQPMQCSTAGQGGLGRWQG